eukprot:scaffold464_cov130-Skeletonema_marinoi.AAC.2
MRNTYIINTNPAVTYYLDKKRFGHDVQLAEQTSQDASRKTQEGHQCEDRPTKFITETTLEQKFRQYLAAFDGKKKDFSEVEHVFDALFHEEFSDTINVHHQAVSREHIKTLHTEYFAMGTKATLIHYRIVGLNTVDVSYNLFNDQEEVITRQLFTRQNGRVVRAQKISYLRVVLNADDVCDGKQFVRFTEVENSSSSYLKARWNSNAYREMAGLIISL